ncbi:MAG TPA: response regulator [Aggregatilineales bacterium]|nr:response regulator [Aggregatilineales bacterium]
MSANLTRFANGDQRQPTILVTDDEAEARMLFRRVLERESFHVEEAENGEQAVAKAQRLHPDLILMDIQMPGVDGFEVVQILRSDPRTERIPVIVVTAAARDPLDVARGLGLGADDYLRKPYNNSELVARVRSNIRARQLEERLQQRTEELESLIRIGGELNQELELEELADAILAATLRQIPADSAVLVVLVPGEQPGITPLTRYYGLADILPNRILAPGALPAHVIRSGEAVSIPQLADDSPVQAILDATPLLSGIAAPLKHRGEVLGVLALGSNAPNNFSSGDFSVLRSIAEQATLAIRNAQLYTELRGYAQGLEGMVEARTAALQSAQAQLARAEKLAALGTLAAGVAHEVNNPLQPLLTNLQMALEDMDEDRPVDRELLEFAERDVQRIQRIVMRLLDFARPSQSSKSLVDIGDIIGDVLSLAGKQLEHAHVRVRTALEAHPPVLGNADQLKQVFLNLVVNAMEAMPDGGSLDISSVDQGGYLVVIVKDTGTGITAEQLPQVFDPFFTTKSDGTGLGLSVTYGIIEAHSGQIEAESEPGHFTQFKVKLPIFTGDPAAIGDSVEE